MLMLVRSGWKGGYVAITLKHYNLQGNKKTVEEEGLGERYSKLLFPSACFGPIKKMRLNVVTLKL